MKFRTEILIKKEFEINYDNSILGLGSCFVENIGQKLQEGKFKTRINPFGILYHPAAVSQGIHRLLEEKKYEEKDIFFDGELWHSWMHHGSFSSRNKNDCLEKINTSFSQGISYLSQSETIIVTLGTAFAYELKKEKKVVANCHKINQNLFTKKRWEIDDIVDIMSSWISKMKNKKIILTVSPVRHVRDGILENQKSKSILLLATEKLCQKFDFVFYFPSYEIVMDELRDYRFYNSDLIHPNKIAIDFIWEKFRQNYFSEKAKNNYSEVLKIVQGFQHKILHKGTSSHISFMKFQIKKAELMMEKLPVDFNAEINFLKSELKSFS